MKHSIELKIKVKNLADEAKTIRTEERKLRGMEKWRLQHHRRTKVRSAARQSQIAYLHIWGRSPLACMAKDQGGYYGRCRTDYPEVSRMVKKYGDIEAVERLPELEKIMRGT